MNGNNYTPSRSLCIFSKKFHDLIGRLGVKTC
jgi:hypothetical protein